MRQAPKLPKFFEILFNTKHWEHEPDSTHYYDTCVIFPNWEVFRQLAYQTGVLPFSPTQDRLIKALKEELGRDSNDTNQYPKFEQIYKVFYDLFKVSTN